MAFKLFIGAALCAALTHVQTASAQVAEVRAGLTEFDERTLNLPGSLKFADENSVGVNTEIIFEEPEVLKWALSPQPYVNGTLNLGGKTSFAGGGLMWRQSLGDRLYADFAFGGVIHDGETDVKFSGPETDESISEFFRRLRTEIEFGSRLLFREQVTLGVRVNEDWAAEVFVEHLSNGTLIGDGQNDGVNSLGVKASRRF
ncbi:acyloxyacyl hydrolase [Litorimonas sp. WD9-15]|uniref:acyloxyacyl hydrolase n=1 Tax=Litorimonas sp. WD9-15 TaxID=3418716 RepID=UPI003D08E25B